MVAWYDPSQLLKTGIEVFVSTLFGRHSDHRLMEAVINPKRDPGADYTTYHKIKGPYEPIENNKDRPRGDIWVDYVADTGDGWDSTYAIAYALAKRRIDVVDGKGRTHETHRGAVLVLGGDEVYPTANRKEYEDRLISPFNCALKRTVGDHPHVYAIPGNHDWYDSLVSFTRVFISKEWFAGWYAPQDRSYFALKLPGKWWFIGIDTQLGSDIDGLQVEYFETIAKEKMGDDDRVVLCCAEPQWIYQQFYNQYDAEVYNNSNLAYLGNKVFKGRIRAYVAGDLHHYRRHANEEGTQKITAGGGGAFLHPTHAPDAKWLPGDELPKNDPEEAPRYTSRYELQTSFPDVDTSRRLTRNNLLFPWLNPWFGGFCAGLYFLVAWIFGLTSAGMDHTGSVDYLCAIGARAVSHPAAGILGLLVVVGVAFFTDTHNPMYKWVAGMLHGLSHLAAIFLLGWVAIHVKACMLGDLQAPGWIFIVKGSTIMVGAWFLGSMIMGLYLFLSLNYAGRHYNEAFSSLSIPDYKNFLRFHAKSDGTLTIYPMKIERVPRSWRPVPPSEDKSKDRTPTWEPAHGEEVKVELIEGPIVVDRDPKHQP